MEELFASVRQAETVAPATVEASDKLLDHDEGTSDGEEEGVVVHTFVGDVNPLTTILLLTNEAWKIATANDHDMKLCMTAMQYNKPLDTNKL